MDWFGRQQFLPISSDSVKLNWNPSSLRQQDGLGRGPPCMLQKYLQCQTDKFCKNIPIFHVSDKINMNECGVNEDILWNEFEI